MRDQLIFDLLNKELKRQREGIELIASENFTSLQVMQATGSVATNKYAEGYPGKRYYGGCEVVDEIEQLAIDRLKKVFNASWTNVQPRLYIGPRCIENFFQSVNGQLFNFIYHFTTSIIPFSRITLGIFIGGYRTCCLHDLKGCKILRSDEFDAFSLSF